MSDWLLIKRDTWCRVFHRWHRRMYRDGWTRSTCRACEGIDWPIPKRLR